MTTGKALLRWILILVAFAVGVLTAMWSPLKFVNLGGADFASRFSVLVFFSLLIERTVEILMSIWRSQEANEREAAVRRLVQGSASNSTQIAVRCSLLLSFFSFSIIFVILFFSANRKDLL